MARRDQHQEFLGSHVMTHHIHFHRDFAKLTGDAPFPWQAELFERFVSDEPDNIPSSCDLPTGLGKPSVVAIWLLSLASRPEKLPRRLVYVVNRRTVVDQTTTEAQRLRRNLRSAGLHEPLARLCARQGATLDDDTPLASSTLRGQLADNGEWRNDPSRRAVVEGTIGVGEVQLMDVGLATSAQLQAFRDQDRSRCLRPCFRVRMSLRSVRKI